MPLSESKFTSLVEAGCPSCPGKRLVIEALVEQRLTLLEGEPYGAPAWGYKGEELAAGTTSIACGSCKKVLFSATACPRCDAAGGVARAMTTENAFAIPEACEECGCEEIMVRAWVPAIVGYDGKRASKARAQATQEEPGFHAFRVSCKQCKWSAEQDDGCALCGG